MMKERIKSARGVSLVSLAIAVAVLTILANIVIYNVRDGLRLGKLKEMQSDISNLRDKISSYYAENGKIPAKLVYTNTEAIEKMKSKGVVKEEIDKGRFLVIDLSAFDNLTLNRGNDYEKIKTLDSIAEEQAKSYTDIYIMNETSHNIFYVEGISIDDEIYYTDYTAEDTDTLSVDLRYKEGVKIPEGFYYVEGTKDIGILIRNSDNTEAYKWMPLQEKITEIPNNLQIQDNQKEDFIKSANAYQGYYVETTTNRVKYLELENWSPSYDKEGIYKDKNGDTAYIPQGFKVSETPGQNTVYEGLVVKDESENEWVWIEVPKSIYTTAKSSEDYANIEKDMQTYASDYRGDLTDTFYATSQHGFSNSTDYNNWKNSMLKSVYEKGGFYIGRYEVGATATRTASSGITATPVIKRDVYPYNYITCTQAQTLAKQLATGGKTSSLMFGIQWDLMLKFIETQGAKTQAELKEDSASWGNFYNPNFTLTKGAYATSSNTSHTWTTTWKIVTGQYTKPSSSVALLTTGATDRNSVLNIYDIAGNVREWTLENPGGSSAACSMRGSSAIYDAVYQAGADLYRCKATERHVGTTTETGTDCGFRTVLW